MARGSRTLLEILLALIVVVGLNVIAQRHYRRVDLTRGRSFALSEKSIHILQALDRPVEVIVFMLPNGPDQNGLFGDVRELLARARAQSPRLRVEYVDIDRDPGRLKVVGKRYGISGDDLMNGVIVVASGKQSKYLTRSDLADYDYIDLSAGAPPRMIAWKGEQALDEALLAVTEERAPLVCFTTGHGEPAFDSFAPGGLGDFAEALRRDHDRVRGIDLGRAVPAACDAVAVVGPEQPFLAAEVAKLSDYLDRGGHLLAMIGPTFDSRVTRILPIGIEPLLARFGAVLADNVVIDEPHLRDSPVAFAVSDGYSDDPIVAQLEHRRTLWTDARAVHARAAPGLLARVLVHSSPAGWGETNLDLFSATARLRYDRGKDEKGPLPLAVASERTLGQGKGARLVVLGSSELAATPEVLAYNRDLLLSSVAWLTGAAPKVGVGPRAVEHLRLLLDDRQLRRIFLLCVVVLPLLALLGGVGAYLGRRA